jgi:hypothetical protein
MDGTANLTGDALLEFASGGISSIASGAQLTVSGANARVADANSTGSNSALTGLSGNAGTFILSSGTTLATNTVVPFSNTGTFSLQYGSAFSTNGGIDFDNSGTLNVDAAGGAGGSTLTVGGVLSNTGTVNLGTNFGGGNISAPITVTTAGLSNAGTINIEGSGPSYADAGVDGRRDSLCPAGSGYTAGAQPRQSDSVREFHPGSKPPQ